MSKSESRDRSKRTRRSRSSTARRSLPRPDVPQMDLFSWSRPAPTFSMSRPGPADVFRQVAPFSLKSMPRAVTQKARSSVPKLEWQMALPFPDAVSRAFVCAKRSIRKEVLHAFRKTGKAGQKRPVRTRFSNVKCGG